MIARLNFLPPTEHMRTAVAKIYGNHLVKIENNEIVVLKKPRSTELQPLIMATEQLADEKNINALADYILDHLNDEFEGIDKSALIDNIMAKGLPDIYSDLGLISRLKMHLGNLIINTDTEHQKKILQKDLLPLIINSFKPYSCVSINIDFKLQQSIFSFLKVGLYIHEHGKKEAQKKIDNGIGTGMVMTGGFPVLAMLDAYTCLAASHYTLPLHFTAASFHFLFDGALTLTHEMRRSLQNIFQAEQNPMVETRELRYSIESEIETGHNYMWRYLRFSVYCVNSIMSYANNPFHFLNNDRELKPEKQLQFFSALYLLYADMASINHTASKHIQHHLAFSAIEKIANLVLGHLHKKNLKERNIAHILLAASTCAEVQSIIADAIGETAPDLSTNLRSLTGTIYKIFHEKLQHAFCDTEAKNIGRFYNFRKFYAHGSFLDQDVFKQAFSNTQANVPAELVFIPYCLMLGLSCNPERFFSYMQEQINAYDFKEYA